MQAGETPLDSANPETTGELVVNLTEEQRLQALVEQFHLHKPRLKKFAMKILNDPDLVKEAMISLSQELGKKIVHHWDPNLSALGLLLTYDRYICFRIRRTAYNQARKSQREFYAGCDRAALQVVITSNDLDFHIDLEDACQSLEPTDVQIIHMIMQGYTRRAIGKEIGMSERNVGRRLQKLREILEPKLRSYC